MDDEQQVLEAARARAAALAAGDAQQLLRLLHADFRWTSHTGTTFDRASYIASNTGGTTVWLSQQLVDPEVTVVADTAVLRCVVTDEVEGDAGPETFRMPLTQIWVNSDAGWTCLAGHAGPRQPD